jgi:hypothetical protein
LKNNQQISHPAMENSSSGKANVTKEEMKVNFFAT